MAANMAENSTSTEQPKEDNSLMASNLFVPIVIGMVALVLVLSTIIIVMCARRKCRRRQHQPADDIIMKVVNIRPYKELERGISTPSWATQASFDSASDSIISGGNHQDASRHTSISSISDDLGLKPRTVHFSNTSYLQYPTIVIDSEDENFSDYTKRSRQSSEPPPVLPRPQETLMSPPSPTLPKIKGRKTKTPVLTQLSLVDNKEATLKRASNIFRSDTKAHKFYAQTMTNYEVNPQHIRSQRRIGRGHFGFIHEGVAVKLPVTKRRNQRVAIKTMKHSSPDSEKQEFLYEIEIMRLVNSLNHPNIIKLMGCVTKTEPYMIILELMSNGNLQKFLRDAKSGDTCYYNIHGKETDHLSEQQLLQFSLDVARGMEGIADLQLLHRDLATRNVLVDENFTCKVADFGFAKDVLNKPEYQSKSVFQRPRPTRWLPPESLFKYRHSIQSDVWSYGVVLWEIVTLGNLPYPGLSSREVMQAIGEGYRMQCPNHCSPELYELMIDCWREEPTERPTFTQLVEKIQILIEKSQQTPNDSENLIDTEKLNEDEYIETLPPDDQELCTEFAVSEQLC